MLSVIIPLGPKDDNPDRLLVQLTELPEDSEILLAVAEGCRPTGEWVERVRVVEGSPGRASQMNAAALEAKGEHLWFLHVDSVLETGTVSNLLSALQAFPDALLYHDLAFQKDGPGLMWLNAMAVRFRSDILKMPFGDQGFAISRQQFQRLGAYDEAAAYGEDHLLVWKARQMGIGLRRTGGEIATSARKYRAGGWGKVTALHVWLTFKQAVPEFAKLLRSKFR